MKSKNLSNILVAGLVLLLAVVSSYGQANERQERKGPRSLTQLFEELDENEDGKLSKAEVRGPLKKHFSKIDLNEDGFLSEEEVKKAPRPKRKEQRKNN